MYFAEALKQLPKSNKNISIRDAILALMALGIPFSIKLGNGLLILSLAYSIFLLKKRGLTIKQVVSYKFIFPLAFFLIVLVSALYSKDVTAGLKQVEKNSLLLLICFPFLIISSIGKINITFVLKVFSLATLVSVLILIIAAIVRIFNGESIDVLFFHEFGAFFDLHPVYIALNICIAIFFITDEYLVKYLFNLKRAFSLLCILGFAIIALILCASKAVILSFIVLYCIQLFGIIKASQQRIILFAGIIMLGFAISKTPILFDRFLHGLHFDISKFSPTSKIEDAYVFSNDEKEEISDLELRYLMLKIGLYHLIEDDKILFGYGIGDVQHHVDYFYMIYGLAPGWFEGYNLHNQYLQYLVTYGILPFLLFCGYLLYSFYLASINKNQLHLYFLILISAIFFFECLLSRNKGIVIFIFFNTLFLIFYRNENSYTGYQRNT